MMSLTRNHHRCNFCFVAGHEFVAETKATCALKNVNRSIRLLHGVSCHIDRNLSFFAFLFFSPIFMS